MDMVTMNNHVHRDYLKIHRKNEIRKRQERKSTKEANIIK